MSNKIQHPCNFCKATVELSEEKREHVCACGVRYTYPNQRKAEKRERQQERNNEPAN